MELKAGPNGGDVIEIGRDEWRTIQVVGDVDATRDAMLAAIAVQLPHVDMTGPKAPGMFISAGEVPSDG